MKFKAERLSSLQDKANSIAKIAAYGVSSGKYYEDYDNSEEEMEKLINNEEIRYVMITMEDSTFYEFNSFTAVINEYQNNEEFISDKYEIMKAYAPIIISDKKVGDIYMGFSLSTVYDKIAELQTNIGLVSLLLFLVGSLVVYFIGKLFTQPLTKVVSAVNKISEGDYSQKLEIISRDEVGFLANSFNEMVDKIANSRHEMNKINKELENRIKERTKELETALKSLQKENIERKKAEIEISKSLHEKEVLLKEIHHRVKNNLQIVSSLFFFQSKQLTDPKIIDMFRDGQNRVKSMALIHEKLYQSGDLANIDFNEYVKKLTNFLFQSFGVNQHKIRLKNNINRVELSVDTAVPCGLIINELISNSLKHGLKDVEIGEIRIDMGYDENRRIILKVSDNGKGMPKDFDIEKSESLGLRLVNNLTLQLNGKVEYFVNNGTMVKINFPDPNMLKKVS